MKILCAVLAGCILASSATASPLARQSSNSWAGTSLYYLQGLSDAEQDIYLSTLASYGVKVVRVWVRAQNQGACEKNVTLSNGCDDFETTIGQYNTATLDLLDASLVKIQKNGMKALISPHDANVLAGYTPDVYGHKWGPSNMYTSPDAAAAYDNRLSAILNHKGAHSGQVWKNWPQGIMAFDIQNEPMLLDGVAAKMDPQGWICGRATHLRNELARGNPIRIASGGVGGSYDNKANFAPWVTGCADLDIISVHYYNGNDPAAQNFLGQGKGKLVHVEEWIAVQGTGQANAYATGAANVNRLGLPWSLWQILPSQTCSKPDSDNTGLYIDSGIDIAGPIRAAASTPAQQNWAGIAV